MPPTAETIVSYYWDRKRAQDPRVAKLLELKDAVEGNIVIPLPERSKAEKPLNPNLVANSVYGLAQRISSTMPDVDCPPARHGDFDVHLKRAQQRVQAIRGWWAMNRMDLLDDQRALYMVAYASAPVVIRPRPPQSTRRMRDIPYWHVREPLTTLPPPGNEIDPPDCLFTFRRSYRWLRDNYSDAAVQVERPKDCSPDQLFDVVEYVDDEILSLIVLGMARTEQDGLPSPGPWYGDGSTTAGSRPFVEIQRIENRTGICPAVVPGRICVGERQGQMEGLVNSQWWMGKAMAMAAEAGLGDVWPSEWLMSRPGETAQIIVPADGPAGVVGEVTGGELRTTHAPPGQTTFLLLNTIERNMRVTGGLPAELQGESATNIRTARRGSQVLSSAIDFGVAQTQRVLAAAREEETVRAIATTKAYYSGAKSFYFNHNGRRAYAEYDPAETFDSDQVLVRYSLPGTDMNELIIGAGQRIGMGAMSKQTWMGMDPLIEDPEQEHQRVLAEGLEQSLLQGLQAKIADGTIPPADAARITKLVTQNGKPLAEAVMQVQAEAQRRQAPDVEPVAPGAPEAQPGLAAPGAGAEAGTVGPPPQGMSNLSDLVSTLRRTRGAA